MLLLHRLLLLILFVEVRVRSLFCYAVLCALSSFAIISLRKKSAGCLVFCFFLSFRWHVAVSDLCLFLMLPLVILHHVIVTSFGPTHLHFDQITIGQY